MWLVAASGTKGSLIERNVATICTKEVVNYVVDPAIHNGTCDYAPLVVNPKKWEELPQHLKDAVILARDRARFDSAMILVDELKACEKWREIPGMQIIRWSEDDLKAARELGMKMIPEEASKPDEGKAFLEIYRNTLHELGYRDEAKDLGYSKQGKPGLQVRRRSCPNAARAASS